MSQKWVIKTISIIINLAELPTDKQVKPDHFLANNVAVHWRLDICNQLLPA